METAEIGRHARALLAEFPNRPGAWQTLAVNLIPLLGFVAFGWSVLASLAMVYVEALLLVYGLSAVLAVHAVRQEHPGPWPVWQVPSRIAKGAAVCIVGGTILNLFTAAGAFSLMLLIGADWARVTAAVAGDPYFAGSVVAVVLLRAVDVVQRLRGGDDPSFVQEAADDFKVVLLRAFMFPVLAGSLIQLLAIFGSVGAGFVLLLMALTITAGDVYRDEWLRLMADPDSPAAGPAAAP
jgi:hypothetical protein